MRIVPVATCLVLLAGVGPLFAQAAPPVRPDASPAPVLRGGRTPVVDPKPSDALMDAERRRSEAQLKRREDAARRTLGSICRGC